MGICASCLGVRQQRPRDHEDLDRILDADQPTYGTLDDNVSDEVDEEELQREQEALQNITTSATDNMIDVLHPSFSDQNLLKNSTPRASSRSLHRQAALSGESLRQKTTTEEAAWLETLRTADTDAIHMPRRGRLVMDVSLRDN